MSPNYYHITYPRVFSLRLLRWIWRRTMCTRGHHLFDEVLSTGAAEGEDFEQLGWGHYLYCDACGMEVVIAEVRNEK